MLSDVPFYGTSSVDTSIPILIALGLAPVNEGSNINAPLLIVYVAKSRLNLPFTVTVRIAQYAVKIPASGFRINNELDLYSFSAMKMNYLRTCI